MVFVSVCFFCTHGDACFFCFFFPVLYCWLHSGAFFFFGRGFGKFGSGLFPMRHRHQTFLSSGCVPVTAGWVINRHLSTKNPTLRLISKAKELWLNLLTKKKKQKKRLSTQVYFSQCESLSNSSCCGMSWLQRIFHVLSLASWWGKLWPLAFLLAVTQALWKCTTRTSAAIMWFWTTFKS